MPPATLDDAAPEEVRAGEVAEEVAGEVAEEVAGEAGVAAAAESLVSVLVNEVPRASAVRRSWPTTCPCLFRTVILIKSGAAPTPVEEP